MNREPGTRCIKAFDRIYNGFYLGKEAVVDDSPQDSGFVSNLLTVFETSIPHEAEDDVLGARSMP